MSSLASLRGDQVNVTPVGNDPQMEGSMDGTFLFWVGLRLGGCCGGCNLSIGNRNLLFGSITELKKRWKGAPPDKEVGSKVVCAISDMERFMHRKRQMMMRPILQLLHSWKSSRRSIWIIPVSWYLTLTLDAWEENTEKQLYPDDYHGRCEALEMTLRRSRSVTLCKADAQELHNLQMLFR